MNFKESYKKANDEIKGDRALLDKILNTPVKEKTKITPFVYKFASCAAAIILVGAIALMPKLSDKAVNEEAAERAETEETVGTYFSSDEKADGQMSLKMTAASETENNKEKTVATESPDVLADMAAASDNTGAVAAYSEEVADDTECAAEESMPVSGGGGGANTFMMRALPEEEVISEAKDASEIINLIGINEESLVPSGMTLTSSEVTLSEFSPEGNITAYEINMVYEKDGAKIILRLTDSATPLALDVAGHSGMVSASKTFGNTDIFITAYNFTLEDVENYLNGIN